MTLKLSTLIVGDIIVAGAGAKRVRPDQRCTVMKDAETGRLYIEADADKGDNRLWLDKLSRTSNVPGFTLSLKSDVRKGVAPE